MNILLVSVHIIAIVGLLLFVSATLTPTFRRYFWIGSFSKIVAGILVGCLYFFYYGEGDTIYFFYDAEFLSDVAKDDLAMYLRFLWSSPEDHAFWQQLTFHEARSNFFVKFASIISLITGDNYWLIATYFSLLSFFGSWYLFQKLSHYFPSSTFASFVALLVFPSVVFWTSGFIKESVANAASMYVAAIFLTVWFKRRIRIYELALTFISLWLLWSVKYHYIALLVPVIATSLVFRFFIEPYFSTRRHLEYLIWSVIFILPILLVTLAHPNFQLDVVMEVIVLNYEIFQDVSDQGDTIHFYDFKPEFTSFLVNAPIALWSGLFRPTLFDPVNALHFAAAIENLFVLTLTIVSFRHIALFFKVEERMLLWSLLVYVVLLCIGITFATPNFGTLSRYRVGYMPFFIFLVMMKNPITNYLESKWRNLAPSS